MNANDWLLVLMRNFAHNETGKIADDFPAKAGYDALENKDS